MRLELKVKLLLYKFFSTPAGRTILRILSSGVKANGLGSGKRRKKHHFYIIITTDAESGYVDRNGRRIWQKENPKAFGGYYYGVRNLMRLFSRHKIKTTFFLSTQCFSSKGAEYKKIKKQFNEMAKNKHEIGLHLHPDSDFTLQKKLSKKFNATSAFFYDYKEKLEIIKTAKEIVKKHLGSSIAKKLISFRWGNWALDSDGAKALDKSGFKVDSSATPGMKGHINDTMKYDWSKVKRNYPWKLSVKDYQVTSQDNSGVMEIPIATFGFFNMKLRADPVYSVLLDKAFEEYYKKADRSDKPFPFVVITHSPEATTKDGKVTKVVKDLDNFISFAKSYDNVRFATMDKIYKKLVTS